MAAPAAAPAAGELRGAVIPAEEVERLEEARIGLNRHECAVPRVKIPEVGREQIEVGIESMLRHNSSKRYSMMKGGFAVDAQPSSTLQEVFNALDDTTDTGHYYHGGLHKVEDREWIYTEGDKWADYPSLFTSGDQRFHSKRDEIAVYKAGFNRPLSQERPLGLTTHIYCSFGEVRSVVRHLYIVIS
jgi:hypothetical protein